MAIPINRLLIWMIKKTWLNQVKTKNWKVGWCNKWCRESNFASGMVWSRGLWYKKSQVSVSQLCLLSLDSLLQESLPGWGDVTRWLLAAAPWLFPSRFKSTKNEQISFPHKFKTRAQELRFFVCVLGHGSDTMAGKGEDAEWLSLDSVLLGHQPHRDVRGERRTNLSRTLLPKEEC